MLKPRAAGRLRLYVVLLVIGFTIGLSGAPVTTLAQPTTTALDTLIPLPNSVEPLAGAFTPDAATRVVYDAPEITPVADYLAGLLGISAEAALVAPDETNIIHLLLGAEDAGAEGYRLAVTDAQIRIEAATPAGLFYGVQTLLQLLPVGEIAGASIPAAVITDAPRFEHRGAMLDVARHFFGVDDVKHVIDLMAAYKLNRLHLHLSDDQGWRIEIKSWPNLTTIGGLTAVGGDEGGFYTQEDYAEIVRYAAEKFIIVIPEIDMPGHTNAAQASYAELNCDKVAREPYTGMEVGFSSLCINDELTYTFIDDVVRELAALTPGPYFHIGGDEAKSTDPDDYLRFIARVQEIVASHGKMSIGWEEVSQAELIEGTVVQHWFSDYAQNAVRQGAKVIVSPASKVYLDMKYTEDTPIGLTWAGTSSTYDSYTWDPSALIRGVDEEHILGVEAPLWTETIRTRADIEFMMFPRLLGVAEIAWSARDGRTWKTYRPRLAAHGVRLAALGINFHRDPGVTWE